MAESALAKLVLRSRASLVPGKESSRKARVNGQGEVAGASLPRFLLTADQRETIPGDTTSEEEPAPQAETEESAETEGVQEADIEPLAVTSEATSAGLRPERVEEGGGEGDELESVAAVETEESGPIQVEHPEAPLLPEFDIAFTGPTALPSNVIKLAPPAGKTAAAPEDVDAVARARADFSRIADKARDQHSQLSSFIRDLARTLLSEYRRVESVVDPLTAAAAEAIDMRFSVADALINGAAENALTTIRTATLATRSLVHGTAAWGRRRIRANADTAGQQVTDIINLLAQSYTDLLGTLSQEVTTAGTEAVQAVETWASNADSTYADIGNDMQDARLEAKRKEAPRLRARAVPMLNEAARTKSTEFNDAIPTVRQQFDQSELGAALHQRANSIQTSGGAAITNAVDQALGALDEQADAARESINGMHSSAHAQLAALRRAARERIKAQARDLLNSARTETAGALKGLEASAAAGLPAFGNTATRIEQTLKRVGDSGAKPLAKSAQAAAADTPNKLTDIARSQRERLKLSASGTTTLLQTREQSTRGTIETDRDTTGTAIDTSAQESVTLITNAAQTHTEAFAKVATGVAQAASEWAKPVAEVFEEAIEQTRKSQLEDRGEGSFHQWALTTRESKEAAVSQAITPYNTPATRFAEALDQAGEGVMTRVEEKEMALERAMDSGIIDVVDEAGCTAALRGLTHNQGRALRHIFEGKHGSLDVWLKWALDEGSHDYNAAINYLAGNTAAGAAHELKASVHWYNDEESRIEDIMRALDPDELAELRRSENGTEALAEVESALGGTDLNVFHALEQGNHARADAYRMRDRIDEARREGDQDALNTVLAEYSRRSSDRGWTEQAEFMGSDRDANAARRTAVQQELAYILGGGEAGAAQRSTISAEDAAAAVETYALRPVEVQQYQGEGEPVTITLHVTGANRDLACALIRHGEGSVEARAARLGVEIQRQDNPNVLNVDTALVDPRLNPANAANEADRAEALRERQQVFERFARDYGGGQRGAQETAQAFAERRLRESFGDDALGGNLVAEMAREEYPSPRTAAMAILYAQRGLGTKEDVMFRFTERMNRDEIATMRTAYRDLAGEYPSAGSGGDLDADLGTGAHSDDWFTELSGDERLRMQRVLLGQPRNDLERAELAAFTAQQQRDETGGLGAALTSGGMADRSLTHHTDELNAAFGGARVRIVDGAPIWTDADGNRLSRPGGANFNERGDYTGPNPEGFRSAARMTKLAAENYAARIDAWANFASMGIAVIGAIVAAVVSVVTGGLAAPLLMAAIAGITGLAAMGAKAAISGGRYGWEAAAVDLGMTAVQALTAGVGQKLALASRGISAAARPQLLQQFLAGRLTAQALPAMGRLTGGPLGDLVLMGAIGGGIGSLGQTALSEATWEKGLGKALENLLAGTVRGMAAGAVTGFVSNKFEDMPLGANRTFGSVMGSSTNPLLRGGMRATSSALGAFAGRETELAIDAASGRYKGDAGDAFVSGLESAGQAAVQDFGAGVGEAYGQRRVDARQRAAGTPPPAEPGTGVEPPLPRRTTAPDDGAPDIPPVRPTVPDTPTPVGGRRTIPEAGGPPPRDPTSTAAPRTLTDTTPGAATRPPATTEEPRPAPRVLSDSEDVEGAPVPRVAATEPAAETGTARRPFAEGAAAAVPDTDFHGRAVTPRTPEAARARTLKGAVRRLLSRRGPFADAHLPNPRDATRIRIPTHSGEEVTVRIRMSTETLPAEAGVTPVARFTRDARTGEYIIDVSAGAAARHVERALAHELAEIRVGHGRPESTDVLNPRSRVAAGEGEGGPPRLSAHDEGRLAELGVIARQLDAAPNEATRARLLADAEQLAIHLGLAGGSADSAARRRIAMDALPPEAQELLFQSVLRHLPEAAALQTVADLRRRSAPSGTIEEDAVGEMLRPPTKGMPAGEDRSRVGETPRDRQRIEASVRRAARREFAEMLRAALLDPSLHTELTLKTMEYLSPDQIERIANARPGRAVLPRDFEFHHLFSVAQFIEWAHKGSVGFALPKREHVDIGHGGETHRLPEAGTIVREERGTDLHLDPRAEKGARARPRAVAEGAETTGDVDRDLLQQLRAQRRRLETNTAANRAEIDAIDATIEKIRSAPAAAGAEGAAARLRGTEMELADRTIITDPPAAIKKALEQVVGMTTGTLRNVTVQTDAGGGMRVTVPVEGGGNVTIRVTVGETSRGDIASFRPGAQGDNADFVVTLSNRAPQNVHARALAHEMAEIRALRMGTGTDDVLRPGAAGRELSAHDRGRLAEVEVLAQRLNDARQRGDAAEASRITHEAELLLSALGMVGNRASHRDRADVATRALAGNPDAQQLLNAARQTAAANPFRTPLTGELDDLRVLSRQIEHARAMGDDQLEARLAQTARRLIDEQNLFSDGAPVADKVREARLAAQRAGPAAEALFNKVFAAAAAEHAARRALEAPARALASAEIERSRLQNQIANGRSNAEQLTREAAELERQARGAAHRGDQDEAAELREEARLAREQAAAAPEIEARARERIDEIDRQMAELRTQLPTDTTRAEPSARPRESIAAGLVEDAVQRELVRQRFGDQPDFQDWPEFRRLYYEMHGSVRPTPEAEARLWAEWRRGSFVDETTGGINTLGDLRVLRPQGSDTVTTTARLGPTDQVVVPNRAVDAAGQLVKTTRPMTPDEAVLYRGLLLAARNHLVEQIINLPDGSAARVAKEAELSRVLADLNQTSEALGVAAGRRFADEQGWTERPLPRAGAGVPDLVFEDANGRLVIIESKGPTAKPITRGAVLGEIPVRAQQGTPEYLTSLAKTMRDSGDPVLIQLGQRILDEMPDVGYFIVQQTVQPSGALGSVRVDEFDMRRPGQ